MPNTPFPTDASPGSAKSWRSVIGRLDDIERQRNSAATEQLATDKGLAATLQNLSQQVATLQSEQAFLLNQNIFASNGSSYTMNTGTTLALNTLIAYNNSFDLEISFVAPPSGKFNITVGASISIQQSTNGGGMGIFPEIIRNSGSTLYTDGTMAFSNGGSTQWARMAADRTTAHTADPGSAVTVRTRRRYTNYDSVNKQLSLDIPTLSITLIR